MRRLLAGMGGRTAIPFRVVFADGTEHRAGDAPPAFTVRFRTRAGRAAPAALRARRADRRVFLRRRRRRRRFRARRSAPRWRSASTPSPTRSSTCATAGTSSRRSNRSLAQAKANARFHYGLGEAFYREWLDRVGMLYTCAYWSEGTTTLEEAQTNKMDHVCRKVGLKAGESFVDVGCGWGGLLFHAWEHYGALGTGINTTTEQVVELRRELGRRGLADRIGLVECDFREIPGQYDKLLSIGTLEHAGRDQLPEVIRAHAAALKPGGLGVIHFIGHVGVFDTEFYIREHIFPGRLDPQPRAGDRGDGALRPRSARRREPAAPLRADARLLGRALRQPLGRDPRARSGPLRRDVPPQLAHVPLVVRRDVPLEDRAARTCSRSPSPRATSAANYPMTRALPVPARGVSSLRREDGASSPRAAPSSAPRRNERAFGLAKTTSNLFRDRVDARGAARRPQPFQCGRSASTRPPASSRPKA